MLKFLKLLFGLHKGMFITFEGGEGGGKTVIIKRLAQELSAKGYNVVMTREPGGTATAEEIRDLLLNKRRDEKLVPLAQLFLFLSSRSQHVSNLILPNLFDGSIILCDRFIDSSVAYQGYGRQEVNPFLIKLLNLVATLGLRPTRTYLFDLSAEVGLARKHSQGGAELNNIERDFDMDFHRRVRKGYLAIARLAFGRIKVVNAEEPVEDVFNVVMSDLEKLLQRKKLK